MNRNPNRLEEEPTFSNFLDFFTGEYTAGRRFAFFLGAGASYESEIPTGAHLVDEWIRELHRESGPAGISCEDWASSGGLQIPGFSFERRAEFYPQIFERRFKTPTEGRRYIQAKIRDRTPSFGYVVLAHILSTTRHNVVITTNFDTLVADALMLFFQKVSLLCGHEAIAEYFDPEMEFPALIQIHGNLLIDPKNDLKGTSELGRGWVPALQSIFQEYNVIFIGYGGNDGSVLSFLQELDPSRIARPLVWCYYEPGGPPKEQVQLIMRRLGTSFIPAPGFDYMMLTIAKSLGMPLFGDNIRRRQLELVSRYHLQLSKYAIDVFNMPQPSTDAYADPTRAFIEYADRLDEIIKRPPGGRADGINRLEDT